MRWDRVRGPVLEVIPTDRPVTTNALRGALEARGVVLRLDALREILQDLQREDRVLREVIRQDVDTTVWGWRRS